MEAEIMTPPFTAQQQVDAWMDECLEWNDDGISYMGGDAVEALLLRLAEERDALKAQIAEKDSALLVLRSGLGAKCRESGEFWSARKWLTDRGIYEGNLSGERVLLEVARRALPAIPAAHERSRNRERRH